MAWLFSGRALMPKVCAEIIQITAIWVCSHSVAFRRIVTISSAPKKIPKGV